MLGKSGASKAGSTRNFKSSKQKFSCSKPLNVQGEDSK